MKGDAEDGAVLGFVAPIIVEAELLFEREEQRNKWRGREIQKRCTEPVLLSGRPPPPGSVSRSLTAPAEASLADSGEGVTDCGGAESLQPSATSRQTKLQRIRRGGMHGKD